MARLRRMFRSLLKEQEDLAWAPAPFAVLEMACVRLATLPAGDDVSRLLTRLDALERRLGGGGDPPAGNGGGTPRQASRPRGSGSSRSRKSSAAGAEAAPGPAGTPAPKSREPGDAVSADAPLDVVLDRLRGFAARTHPGLRVALEGCRLLERPGATLRLVAPAGFAAQRLRDRSDQLESICARFFGRAVRVELTTEGDAPPAARRHDPAAVRQLRQDALNDPGVLAAMEVLEGEIVDIRPLGEGR